MLVSVSRLVKKAGQMLERSMRPDENPVMGLSEQIVTERTAKSGHEIDFQACEERIRERLSGLIWGRNMEDVTAIARIFIFIPAREEIAKISNAVTILSSGSTAASEEAVHNEAVRTSLKRLGELIHCPYRRMAVEHVLGERGQGDIEKIQMLFRRMTQHILTVTRQNIAESNRIPEELSPAVYRKHGELRSFECR